MTNVSPLHCVLHRDVAFHRQWKAHTHTHTTTLPPLHPHSPLPAPTTWIITPPTATISPARAPMSKPNTTDQQLGMQIVSGDKLCAACQLHTWALGWLSVTCVRVPLHLRRATVMTWCRVGLPCTPPAPSHLSVCPQPPFYPFSHSSTPPPPSPTHHAGMRQCVASRRAEDKKN